MAKRKRFDPKPALAAGTVVAILVAGLWLWPREPLTPKEVLEKEEWTAEELTDTIARVANRRGEMQERRKVFEHLRTHLRKLPEEKRKQVVEEGTRRAVDNAYKQWREMPEKAKDEAVKKMKEMAEKRQKTVAALSKKEKEQIRERLESPEGQARMHTMRQKMMNRMTPEDRQRLAPVVRIWIQTFENL